MATLGPAIQLSQGPLFASPAAAQLFVSPLSPPLTTSYAPSSAFIASRFTTQNVMDASRRLQSVTAASNDGSLPVDSNSSLDSAPRTMPTPPLNSVPLPWTGRPATQAYALQMQQQQHQQQQNQQQQDQQGQQQQHQRQQQNPGRASSSSKRKRSEENSSGEETESAASLGLQTPFRCLTESKVNQGGNKRRRGDEEQTSPAASPSSSVDAEPDSSPTKNPEYATPREQGRNSELARSARLSRSSSRRLSSTHGDQVTLPYPSTPKRRLAPECVPDGLDRADFYTRTPPSLEDLRDFDYPWTDDEDRLLIDIVISKISMTDEQLVQCANQLGRAHPDQVGDRLRKLVNFGCIGLRHSLGYQSDRRKTLPGNF